MDFSSDLAADLLISSQNFVRSLDDSCLATRLFSPSCLVITLQFRPSWEMWLWEDLWMRPSEAKSPSGWITFITAGFLHSQFDATHVHK